MLKNSAKHYKLLKFTRIYCKYYKILQNITKYCKILQKIVMYYKIPRNTARNRSVLEYGSICFTNMARTHMLGLERVQYLALRIALGLMRSTPNNCLGVLSGIPPLAERFAYLNFRYLVAAFYRLGHPLRERLGMLGALNMGR
jgi:hypothetical protein